tara:strand:- start:30 stop:356 length:327 start_codon:yes stop_codon:yes gene_type:complete
LFVDKLPPIDYDNIVQRKGQYMIEEMKRKVQLSISVTRREQRLIELYCKSFHITRSEAIRQLMADALEDFEKEDPTAKLIKAEREVIDLEEELKNAIYLRDSIKGRIQ